MQRSLLAIETSGSVCSVAVSVDERLIASIEVLRSNVHDELLSDAVSSVCQYAAMTIADIDIVAVSSGPGSFTGLRIGAAFAKGLCFSGRAKLLPVPTHLSLMAAGLEVARRLGNAEICSVIGSHRDLVYISSTPAAQLNPRAGATMVTIEEAKALLSSGTKLVVGPGAETVIDAPISGLSRTSARFVAYAAWLMLGQECPFVDAHAFVPDYHQEFQPR